MSREKETTDRKPMTLAEARTRMGEHKPVSRIRGNRQGQAVGRREDEKTGGRKGKR